MLHAASPAAPTGGARRVERTRTQGAGAGCLSRDAPPPTLPPPPASTRLTRALQHLTPLAAAGQARVRRGVRGRR